MDCHALESIVSEHSADEPRQDFGIVVGVSQFMPTTRQLDELALAREPPSVFWIDDLIIFGAEDQAGNLAIEPLIFKDEIVIGVLESPLEAGLNIEALQCAGVLRQGLRGMQRRIQRDPGAL